MGSNFNLNFNIIENGNDRETESTEEADILSDSSDLTERVNQYLEIKADRVRNIVVDSYMKQEPRYEEPNRYFREPSGSSDQENNKEDVRYHGGESSQNEVIAPSVELNTRALERDADTYQLEKFEKKVLRIFNHYEIDGYKYPRYGTDEDVKALTNTFGKLGFDVVEHKDYTRDQILEELKNFTSTNFVDYGCIAIAVLTHGSSHGLLRAKDTEYSEQLIIEHLKVHNKPTLITKPKMLIIQACRGIKSLRGVQVFKQMERIQKDAIEEEVDHYTLPIEADMVVVHSTFMGKPASRCELNGSWFIQTLCQKIDLLAEELDFESIFREVNRTIAIDKSYEEYNKGTLEIDICKQMPTITSSLIRKLYLRKYMGTPESPMEMVQSEPDTPVTPVTPSAVTLTDEMPSSTTKLAFGTQVTMQYFEYLKNCMRVYIQDNPDDKPAQILLMLAETFKSGKKYKEPKKKMCTAICEHFRSNSDKIPYYKHIFICESYLDK